MSYAVLWSHGSGFELAGVFKEWSRAIEVIREDNPDHAHIIRYEPGQVLDEDEGGLYGVEIFDDGFFVSPTGEQLVDDDNLNRQVEPPGPEAYDFDHPNSNRSNDDD